LSNRKATTLKGQGNGKNGRCHCFTLEVVMRPDTIPPPPPMPGSIQPTRCPTHRTCPKTASRFTITKGKVRERLTHFHILCVSKRERNKEKGLPQSGFAFLASIGSGFAACHIVSCWEVVIRPGSIQPTRCPTNPHPPSNKPRRIILLYPFLFSQIPYCQSLLKMVISAISFFPYLLITNYRQIITTNKTNPE